tara:strand:- start:1523 stop:1858 length:336 start_codon:yes stop_codon:yes gene_type:complete
MFTLNLVNADSCPKSSVDVVRDLSCYPELMDHTKRKNPIFDNYYDAKDIIMKVLEENDNIIAGVIQRKKKKSVVYFRKTQPGETNYAFFVRLVDNIKDNKKDTDLFIKIVK